MRDFEVRGGEIEEGDDRAGGGLVREIADAEEGAALGVVLLGHDGRAGAIGRDGDA